MTAAAAFVCLAGCEGKSSAEGPEAALDAGLDGATDADSGAAETAALVEVQPDDTNGCDTGCDDAEDDPTDVGSGWQPPEGMVLIQPGTFLMGSPESELGRERAEVQHEVTLTRPFLLQTTEVTLSDYEALMGRHVPHWRPCEPDCPVERVNWYDAIAYANALSIAQGLDPCFDNWGEVIGGLTIHDCEGYRLPTEAEWEYAARAGTTAATYGGDLNSDYCDDNTLWRFAWYCGNSEETVHAVGTRRPNAWGLYDMLGNMWEWVWDSHGPYAGAATDPVGSELGDYRIARGGSWASVPKETRSAMRTAVAPDVGDEGWLAELFSFRLARTVHEP